MIVNIIDKLRLATGAKRRLSLTRKRFRKALCKGIVMDLDFGFQTFGAGSREDISRRIQF